MTAHFVEILPQFRSMNAELKRGVEQSLRGVKQQLQTVSEDTHKMVEHTSGNTMARIGAVASFAGNLAAMGIASLARMGVGAITAGIKTAAGMEQANIAFGTLLHSATKAQTFLDQLSEFAAKTPFELPGLIDASRQLLGVGAKAKDVIPTLTAYGDAAGALGISQDGFNRIMLATTQAMSAGTLHAGDLLQMTEAGLPVWKLLSEALGKPVSEIKKLSEQGKLMSADVLPKLQAQMEKDYGGSMSKQSQTLSGLWSTLMDTLHQGEAKILMPLEPLMRQMIPKAAEFMGKAFKTVGKFFSDLITGVTKGKGRFADLRDVFTNLKDTLKNVGQFFSPFIHDIIDTVKHAGGASHVLKNVSDALKDMSTWLRQNGDVIRPVIAGILAFMAAWKTYRAVVSAIKAINGAIALLGANPIGLVIAAIAALVLGFIYAYKHSETFRNAVDKLWKSLKESAEKIVHFFGVIGKNVTASFDDMSKVADRIKGAVSGFFSGMTRNVMASFTDMTKAGDKVKAFFVAIPGALSSMNTAMSKLGHDIVDRFRSGASDNWHTVSAFFSGTLKRIDTAIGNARQWATNFGTNFITNVQRGNTTAWHLVNDWSRGWLGRVGSAIGDYKMYARNIGLNFINSHAGGLRAKWPDVSSWWHGMLGRIGSAIGDFRAWARRVGNDLIQNELRGVTVIWHIMPDWFRGMIGRIAAAIGNWTKYFHDIGWGMITGLLRGLGNTWHIVTDWFGKVPGWIKSALGIHSPPDWAVDAGGWIMKGLVKGLIGGSFSFTSFLKFLTGRARTVLTSFLSGAHGSVGAGGLHQDILNLLAAIRRQFGAVRLISGLRPGARTLSGAPSRHAVGEAIDIPAVYAITKWISETFGRGLRELISPWNSLNILRGQHHVYTGDVFAQHAGTGRFAGNAHTHAAYRGGAWRIPSDQLAYLHAREMVVPAQAADAIRSGGGNDDVIAKFDVLIAAVLSVAPGLGQVLATANSRALMGLTAGDRM